MEIGIIGNGTMAAALGAGWIAAGHTLLIGGRSRERTAALADRLGPAARAVTPREAAEGGEAVLLAVRWEDVEEALGAAGGADGTFAGTPLIDCTNAVEHGVGALLTAPGEAAAQRIAALAPARGSSRRSTSSRPRSGSPAAARLTPSPSRSPATPARWRSSRGWCATSAAGRMPSAASSARVSWRRSPAS